MISNILYSVIINMVYGLSINSIYIFKMFLILFPSYLIHLLLLKQR